MTRPKTPRLIRPDLSKQYTSPIAWEKDLPIRQSSLAWRSLIKAFYGETLDPAEIACFRRISGGREPTPGGDSEILVVAGRRGGKSETTARLAIYEACYGGHKKALARGQYGLIPIISPLKEQSMEIMRYCKGFLDLPQVKPFVESEPTLTEIRFKTRVIIRVMAADALNVSGPTIVCAIRDEAAKFGGDESAMSDREIENSLRPALAPVKGAPKRRLISITSAYTRDGIAYEADRDWYSKANAPLLVVRGNTETFNPNIDQAWLAKERVRVGEKVYRREYEAEWQDATLDGYFNDVLEASIDRGREVSHPRDGYDYWIAIDPAWKGDRWAIAVVHREREGLGALKTVVDMVKVWSPQRGKVLSTEETLAKVAAIARQHGTEVVYTDQASGPALVEMSKRVGLHLVEVPWTGGFGHESKSSKFRRVHSGMADGLIRLPDDPDTIREFSNVSSKLLKSGAERIEARVGHDDRVHAVVMAIAMSMEKDPDYHQGDGKRSEYEILCEQARAKMDAMELGEMERAEQAAEQNQWNRAGLGQGLGHWTDQIDWNHVARYRGI